MNWLRNMFRQKPQSRGAASARVLRSSDNLGTLQDTESKVDAYWMKRLTDGCADPFILYNFSSASKAKEAMCSLDFIGVADDTGKLVCTKILEYGVYSHRSCPGKTQALLAGADLTWDVFQAAKSTFESHGGEAGRSKEPDRRTTENVQEQVATDIATVVFIREEMKQTPLALAKYRYYKAPDEATALEYSKIHAVNERFTQVLVEYPGGCVARDIDGIYRP